MKALRGYKGYGWRVIASLGRPARLYLESRTGEVLPAQSVEGVPTKNRDSVHTFDNESIEGREQKQALFPVYCLSLLDISEHAPCHNPASCNRLQRRDASPCPPLRAEAITPP